MGGRAACVYILRTVGQRVPDDKDRIRAVRHSRQRRRSQDTFRRGEVHNRRSSRLARREPRAEKNPAPGKGQACRRLAQSNAAQPVPDHLAVLFLLPRACQLHRGEILDNKRLRGVRRDNPDYPGVPHGENDLEEARRLHSRLRWNYPDKPRRGYVRVRLERRRIHLHDRTQLRRVDHFDQEIHRRGCRPRYDVLAAIRFRRHSADPPRAADGRSLRAVELHRRRIRHADVAVVRFGGGLQPVGGAAQA